MANEAQVRSSITIRKDDLYYVSQPQQFNVDVSEARGPTPGTILATIYGTDVDISLLTVPGLCRIQNLDATNWIEYGIRDPETNKFYPLGEVGPGESYPMKLSRNIEWEYAGSGTGTGTSGDSNNRFCIRANTASCYVLVEAFER